MIAGELMVGEEVRTILTGEEDVTLVVVGISMSLLV
jgi:hypothetical protein